MVMVKIVVTKMVGICIKVSLVVKHFILCLI